MRPLTFTRTNSSLRYPNDELLLNASRIEGTISGGWWKITISISRTREIAARNFYSGGIYWEEGEGGLTVNHADVRGSTGNWIPDETRSNYSGKWATRSNGEDLSTRPVRISCLLAERVQPPRSVDFSFIKRSPFSEWRPLCLGNADHGSHIVRVPLSLSTSSLSSSLSNDQPFLIPLPHIPPLFSKDLDPILSPRGTSMEWMDYRPNLNKPSRGEIWWKIR